MSSALRAGIHLATRAPMMKRLSLCVIGGILCVAAIAQGQTLRSETTWGGAGSDVAYGVAVDFDGSSYVTGISDSFAVDQFGIPAQRIFLTRFAADGSLVWQRIWNGQTLSGGLRGPSVALGANGAVFVSGRSVVNGNDAVVLKFDAFGNLIWERTWGGSQSEDDNAVATDIDGSVYVAGTTTSFGPSSAGMFVVKLDANGSVLWQKIWDGAAGMAVAVAPDGSVYASGAASRPDSIAEFDVVVIKLTSNGTLLWDRRYRAGDIVDPRGGMAASPDGSVVIGGAIQAPAGGGIVDIAALVVRIDANGNLLFDREWGGKSGDVSAGVSVSANGAIHLAGTSTSSGAGFQDAFVVRVRPDGKADAAVTSGGAGFETGAGVGVAGDGTVVLAATTTVPPPFILADASRKLSRPHGTLAPAGGALTDVAGTISSLGLGTTVTNGTTTFGGNFETAVVRFVF